MKFTRTSNWAEMSECGRYTVAAARVDGGFVFQAWRKGVIAELLHTDKDSEKCRRACREHAAQSKTEGATTC